MKSPDPTARTWVEVDLTAIADNLHAMSERLPESTAILLPVKANAYGHGLVPVSRAALAAGAWGLGVAGLDEAETLRGAAIAGRILCLMPILPSEAVRALELDVTAAITDWEQAEALDAAARSLDRPAAVHVEVDTGMGRSGVVDRDAADLVERIAELPGLFLEGIFTHFASADDAERAPTERQIDRFDTLLEALAERGIRPPIVHAANSAAALRFRRAARTLVRPGIAIYGSVDGVETFRPALEWHARVVAVKQLLPGETVSYGRSYTARSAERIALLAVGYGDGLPYTLSNRGHLLLRGRQVPIRGTVCMDLTMVDATAIPDLQPGDTATLIGRQGASGQTAQEVAHTAGILDYTVLTSISARVPRLYSSNDSDKDGTHGR